MIRWTPPNPTRPLPAIRWQSREEILKKHLDSLSPEQLRQVRPTYYWLKFGLDAWKREQARKANFNPSQPLVPAGTLDGGQWTSEGASVERDPGDPMESFAAARRRGRSVAYCMAQYAVDGLLCNSVERSRQRACWAQAGERLANCISGRQIPPLNF